MYTFLIADDEKAIRENIPKVIDFEKYGFSLCAIARDGEEALEKTKELHPNLVLLDIRMPKLDGLGYLKELKIRGVEDTKVIIISGYSDFTYAQTALKYGARGYLTKPLDEDELIGLLTDIKDELDISNQVNRKDYIHKLSENLIKIYHDGNGDLSEYKEFSFLHFVILSKEEQAETYSQIYENLCEIFQDEVELFISKGSVYSFLCTKKAITIQGCINKTAISHVINHLSNKGIECAVIVDNEMFGETGNTFRSDFDAHLYSMLTDVYWNVKENIIIYSGDRVGRSMDGWQSIKSYVANLKAAVYEENSAQAFKYTEAILEEIKSKQIDFTSLIEIYYRVFYTLKELVIVDEDENDFIKAVRWQDSPYFITHEEMEERSRNNIQDIIEYIGEERRNRNLGIGEKATQFIKNNFMKPILLKDVADALYVNSAYLGRCVQKETGLSFNNYLSNLRMERAKDLLINTDMMVYEVAEAVGYTESKHFVTKFTSSEGCAPLSYRKKYRKV